MQLSGGPLTYGPIRSLLGAAQWISALLSERRGHLFIYYEQVLYGLPASFRIYILCNRTANL